MSSMGLEVDERLDWARHARYLYTTSRELVFCGPQGGKMGHVAARDERWRRCERHYILPVGGMRHVRLLMKTLN
jgi:hypothetical protein